VVKVKVKVDVIVDGNGHDCATCDESSGVIWSPVICTYGAVPPRCLLSIRATVALAAVRTEAACHGVSHADPPPGRFSRVEVCERRASRPGAQGPARPARGCADHPPARRVRRGVSLRGTDQVGEM
jgi:hypothetical protein